MKKIILLILVIILLQGCKPDDSTSGIVELLGVNKAAAAPATPPRTWKYTFLTSATYTGNLGGISGADAKCNSDSNKPANSGTYKAMLGTLSPQRYAPNFDWVFVANQEYRRSDGAVIGTPNSNRIFYTLKTGICNSTSKIAWTGLSAGGFDGTSYTSWSYMAAGNCAEFTSTAANGTTGDMGSTAIAGGTGAITGASYACTTSFPICCIEQ